MQDVTQISALISASTKARLERYTEAHGLKQGAVVEAALLHHLQALDELPLDVIIPPRLLVDPETFKQVSDLVADPPPPTEAMRALMAGQVSGQATPVAQAELDAPGTPRYVRSVETIGLREFNLNPTGAIARVRAGALIVVTDRGKPVFRMVPEVDSLTALQRAVAAGEAQAPGELGMPEVVPDLAASIERLAELLVADRDRERRR